MGDPTFISEAKVNEIFFRKVHSLAANEKLPRTRVQSLVEIRVIKLVAKTLLLLLWLVGWIGERELLNFICECYEMSAEPNYFSPPRYYYYCCRPRWSVISQLQFG